MSKTITANIPAKTINLGRGMSRKVPARVETITQDDAGQWRTYIDATAYPITEAEAIDILRKASNWQDIRREHFAMHGFHA